MYNVEHRIKYKIQKRQDGGYMTGKAGIVSFSLVTTTLPSLTSTLIKLFIVKLDSPLDPLIVTT